MRIDDGLLEAWGTTFAHFDIGGRYDITFERFVELNMTGAWLDFVNHAAA